MLIRSAFLFEELTNEGKVYKKLKGTFNCYVTLDLTFFRLPLSLKWSLSITSYCSYSYSYLVNLRYPMRNSDMSSSKDYKSREENYLLYWCHFPAGIYLLIVNNRNTITRFEICSKFTIKTLERRHCSSVFIVKFEHVIVGLVICYNSSRRR